MGSKKPKPATAGEKIADKYASGGDWGPLERRDIAGSIDRAIARAVRKERERCGFVVYTAKCNCESFEWARDWILNPEKQQ